MIIKGEVVKLGDNIDTDLIIPGRYLQIPDINELKKHAFEDLDDKLHEKITGKILVAGENFGCGSSREHAPRVLKAAGVKAIIAKSFARIFFRNAINIGLPVFVSPQASEDIHKGDNVEIDSKRGIIKNITQDRMYHFKPYPSFLEDIIESGGLVEYIKAKIQLQVQDNPYHPNEGI